VRQSSIATPFGPEFSQHKFQQRQAARLVTGVIENPFDQTVLKCQSDLSRWFFNHTAEFVPIHGTEVKATVFQTIQQLAVLQHLVIKVPADRGCPKAMRPAIQYD